MKAVRTIQQQLNYNYYDYFQICPCDGLYNRDMNKMLIYALQKELGIPKSSANGARNVCKTLTENTSSLGIDNLFVSDASYGFSENLGFQMPKKWD